MTIRWISGAAGAALSVAAITVLLSTASIGQASVIKASPVANVESAAHRNLLIAAIQAHFPSAVLAKAIRFYCKRLPEGNVCTLEEEHVGTKAAYGALRKTLKKSEIWPIKIDGDNVTYRRLFGPVEITAVTRASIVSYLVATHAGIDIALVVDMEVERSGDDISSQTNYRTTVNDDEIAELELNGTIIDVEGSVE